jgi:23S rRNA (guanosine2251-2'-O)-methyltransferase
MEQNVIYGKNAVAEALRGKRRIKEILVSTNASPGTFDQIRGIAKVRGIPFQLRNPASLNHLAKSDSHQGIVAIVEKQRYFQIPEILHAARNRDENPFLIILDGIEDPQNLGSVIRTADCAGVHGIIIPEHHAVGLTGSVAKVASGAAEHVKIARVADLTDAIDDLKDRGVKIVGTDADAKPIYYNIPMREPVAIVIGSEGEGIRKSVKDRCDILVSIPLRGKINSLNAAVAAAVMMFEAVRQRTK